MTNREKICTMSDLELAQFLFYRGNCTGYCYGICAYQDRREKCHGDDHCIEGIVKWLNTEYSKELIY